MTDAVGNADWPEATRPTLDTMAAAYAAVVAEKQLAFDELVGTPLDGASAGWSADLDAPSLQIGGHTFTAALLGSAAEHDGTWLWGWANPAFGPGHPATRATSELRRIGAEFDVPELTRESLPLSSVSDSGLHAAGPGGGTLGPAHTLAVVATGVLGARAYYAGAYEGGAAFLAVTDDRLAAPVIDPSRVPEIIGLAIEAFPHHHRLTVETYLGHHGLTAERLKDGLIAHMPDDRGIVAFAFDAHDRLINLETELVG